MQEIGILQRDNFVKRDWVELAYVFTWFGRLFLHSGQSSQFDGLKLMINQDKDPQYNLDLVRDFTGYVVGTKAGTPTQYVCTNSKMVRALLTMVQPLLKKRREEVQLALQLLALSPGRGKRLTEEEAQRRHQLTEEFKVKYVKWIPPKYVLTLDERLKALTKEIKEDPSEFRISTLEAIYQDTEQVRSSNEAFDKLFSILQKEANGVQPQPPATERSHEREVTNGENDIDNQQQREGESVQNP